jgi:DNA polymerase III delta prime subunit
MDIWCEKYRPQKLKDILLDKKTKKYFENLTKPPHLLFTGSPGIGKTTLAKIIVNDICKCDHLYINASDERGIDTIREKVVQFARTKSYDNGIKIIILDEADGISLTAQKALRNIMEEYYEHCRFILTANAEHKIVEALHSRCTHFKLKSDIKSYFDRVIEILNTEKVVLSREDQKQIAKIVKTHYPDLRTIINRVQVNCNLGSFNVNDNETLNSFIEEVLTKVIFDSVVNIRKHIIQNEDLFDNDYTSLLRNLLNYAYTTEYAKEDFFIDFVICISEYLYRSAFVMDQEINAISCILNLKKIINK